MSIVVENQKRVLEQLTSLNSPERIYQYLISLGQNSPPLSEKDKVEANRVHGCQSQLYLICEGTKEALFFQADSDALISKGIALLLLSIYNGASAEEIAKSSLSFFKQFNLHSILSPSRLNGLEGLEKRIKQTAINYLL